MLEFVKVVELYEKLDPITGLEQQVAADLTAAFAPRGGTVKHHGDAAKNAPSIAPADIVVTWNGSAGEQRLLVEVTQQLREAEYGALVSHLDAAVAADPQANVNLLYASPRTSNRLARLIRNENQRRSHLGIRGRIVHLRFRDLQPFLEKWSSAPSAAYPLDGLSAACAQWDDYVTDIAGAISFQAAAMPGWKAKAAELDEEQQRDVAARQQQLKRDIVNLENKLRERGITGERAQKALVFVFFIAIHEDKRGSASRATIQGFKEYKKSISPGDLANPADGYVDRTLHHLMDKHIRYDAKFAGSGMFEQYEPLQLPDSLVIDEVLPIFEKYPLSDAGVDFIGAVFEAMARKAEKDNRIGQFFTPETAVTATSRLVGLRADDVVLDPACGTGRFLIKGMGMMLAQAKATATKSKEEVEEDIRKDQLLGTEITPWVAAIAKMNMYLHGDGKSNVKAANGLTLSAMDVFAPRVPVRATGEISVVLMNPPLGDLNFKDVGRDLARLGLLSKENGNTLSDADLERLTVDWSRKHLHAVEHVSRERLEQEKLEKQIAMLEGEREQALVAGKKKQADGLKRRLDRSRKALAEVQARILSGDERWTPKGGSRVKGGALFLSVVRDYLKVVRSPGDIEEWQGGMAGVVIDESLLNTDSYTFTRAFIRRNFFVKAVISLPREAFAFLAKTTAKTSIILIARKPKPDVDQIEPVFYARAEDIGYTSTGLSPRNDLPAICEAFEQWREAVKGSWNGPFPESEKLDQARAAVEAGPHGAMAIDLPADRSARLDYAYQKMQRELLSIAPGHKLGDFVESVVNTPTEGDEGADRVFASASGVDGRVRHRATKPTKYKARDLRELAVDDILVSGIDLVRGAVGVVPEACAGMIVSKEYFVFRVRDDKKNQVLPSWAASVLRSHTMRSIVEGTITGVSNRTRVENPEVLLNLPINPPPSMEHQQELAGKLQKAFDAQDQAASDIQDLQDRIATGEA